MASSSFLITSIHSALSRINRDLSTGFSRNKSNDSMKREVKIGLRNLKVLLLCTSKMDGDDGRGRSLASLLKRIKDVIFGRIISVDVIEADFFGTLTVKAEVQCLGREFDDELSNWINQSSLPVDYIYIVEIAGCILENAADFLAVIGDKRLPRSTDVFEIIDVFVAHTSFMKSFLLFAMFSGVDLQDLLFHVRPIAINAARVFVNHDGREVALKCSAVIRMATDPQLFQAYSLALSSSKFSRPSHDAPVFSTFLDSLISLFWSMLRHADSKFKEEFKVLYERLRFSRTILKNSSDNSVRAEVGVLICDAGVLICSLDQTDPGKLSDLLHGFDVFQTKVDDHQFDSSKDFSSDNLTNIKSNDGGQEKKLVITTVPGHPSPKNSTTPRVVHFDDDEGTSIFDRLTRGSKQLRIVPICGMAGLGKTTFSLEIYNHPSVIHRFHTRAWCPISQVLDKKKVFLQLLNQIDESRQYTWEMTEDDLANRLRQSLKGKRYLILLDDVWTPQVWNDLKPSFPDDSTHSRIIITSQRCDIVPHALPDEQPHLLRLRDYFECRRILNEILSHKEGWDNSLGFNFAKECKGLPLTVVMVAGLLASTEKESWNGILDLLKSGLVSDAKSALELSYSSLPSYLKPCLLYFSAFPEDDEISVKRLIRLWMAEGFVIENEFRRTEDVAQEYLVELIERNLVMVVGYKSIGGVKSCKIHDLVHDFCLVEAKQENFSHLLLQRDQLWDFNEPYNLRRLFIRSFPVHFKESRLFCPGTLSILFFPFGCGDYCYIGQNLHYDSMIFRSDAAWFSYLHLSDMSFIIQIFELLKVLDIYQIELINGIPSEIERLTRLRYLSICTKVPVIPPSLGNLSHLETFIVDFKTRYTCIQISFPHTLWNLQNLKYLCIGTEATDGFTLPAENLESSNSLLKLETIRGVLFRANGSMAREMRKFPNIRRLKCGIQASMESGEKFHKIVVPECVSHLESLTIRGVRGECKYDFGSCAGSLRKLKLDGFDLSRKEIALLGKLPNLVVFKLSDVRFSDNTLEMEEGEFQEVRFLKLSDCYGLETWTVSDEYQLPNLKKLVFRLCVNLKEIPCCLEASSALEEIQVLRCSSTVEILVRGIEEVQKDNGYSIKVRLSDFDRSFKEESLI